MNPHDIIRTMIREIGDDPNRPGLIETPARVVRSWDELFAGYKQDPADVFKIFDENGYNELVLMRDIEFYSMCEHHIIPFTGRAHVAYIASDNRVIGASKLARLLDIFAKRLQTQERICMQVTEALMTHLNPAGAACVIEASHLCMRCRGVRKQNSMMVTSCLRGSFLTDDKARQELMGFINK